ncbi:cation-translocating P-type ATPase [Vagococcus salmoninarum]|uniref:cation-translocating P-type ATPase n=1 Tax=Vagococcus salmoninarum TaxID=2739 RepID=UPI003F9DCB74
MKEFEQTASGLTTAEVAERLVKEQVNNYEENVAKTTQEIIKDNVWTLFNLLNVLIGVALALVGAYSNLFFLVIILLNISIGIYQEIHARNLVAKLSIVSKEKASVIRNGQKIKILGTELVLDDLVLIQAGEQVQSDMLVLAGSVEVNEAMLTGESDLIVKESDSELLSGSFLVSGQCYGQVIRVGQENYASKIASEAKVHKPIQSELVNSIRKVTKFTSFIILPLGLILLLEGLLIRQSEPKMAVVAAAAALLGMLPKGLVLLISIALATAVAKLAQKRILVQDMYSVETLAHVDTLCLDKTGTITQGKMKVQEVVVMDDYRPKDINQLMGSYLSASGDNNITIAALRDFYPENNDYQGSSIRAFSSERKWAGMTMAAYGNVVLGAPEKLVSTEDLPTAVSKGQAEGYRVLMLGRTTETLKDAVTLTKVEPLAVFLIDDPIRENAAETLAYLKAEGVDLKVISGDNPLTVSNIARRAGLPNYQAYVDLSHYTDEAEVRKLVSQYAVFGRVSPQQKRVLVNQLKAEEHVVAMTGDGVNDILALREADCSIAMAEGDSATRQIANLVLLDSDFTSLPDVLFEGRRVVNNVTKVASVFFIKTIYSLILSIICAITALAFPFIPIQITLLDLAIEGYPAFFLSFEKDQRKVKGKFLPTVLGNALPNALLVIMNIVAVYFYGQHNDLTPMATTTLMYYLLIAVSVMAVIKACLPLNLLRGFLIVTTALGTYVAAMLFHHLLEIDLFVGGNWPFLIVMVVISISLKLLIEWVTYHKKLKTNYA